MEDNCINLVEMKFIDNTLYFIAEDDENLESDYFGKLQCNISIIRNLKDQVLFINRGKQAVFEDMSDSDCTVWKKEEFREMNHGNKTTIVFHNVNVIDDNAPQTTFRIYLYKDSDARGMAIAISVKCDKLFTLSCENKVISFKEINPPNDIMDTKSDIIFFQRSVPGHEDKMQFESSLYEGYFLACIKEKDMYKLILKRKDENGDKSVMFTVQNQD